MPSRTAFDDPDEWWQQAMSEQDHDEIEKVFVKIVEEHDWDEAVKRFQLEDEEEYYSDDDDDDDDDLELWEQFLEWKEYNRGDSD